MNKIDLNIQFNKHLSDREGKIVYNFTILDKSRSSDFLGISKVTKSNNQTFWDLEEITIKKEFRRQGYGSKLLNYTRDSMWEIEKLRIRVHPAIGQQAIENLAEQYQENLKKYTEEELDALDAKLIQEMREDPKFWNKQSDKFQNYNSDELAKWYCRRGFKPDNLDKKHLWCYPTDS